MAGTNQFYPFATGGSANTLSNSAWAALTSLLANGFQSGVASSQQVNTVLRQTSFVAAAIGQFIANNGFDANDDTVVANFVTAFSSALKTIPPGRLLNIQVFSTPGSYTYTPTAGTNAVLVTVVGGGGGGGASQACTASQASGGCGGGAGGYARSYLTSAFAGVTITVGAGGSGAPGGGVWAGSNGNSSSFGALLSATGGIGGINIMATASLPATYAGSVGGYGAVGNLLTGVGEPGKYALMAALGYQVSGEGGASIFSAGGPARTQSNPGNSGSYGSGGSGALTQPGANGSSGGAGGSGIVIVEEFS